MAFLKTLAKRFSEPSSWAGVTAVLVGFGVNIPDAYLQAAIYVLAGIAGALSVVLPESST